MSQDDLIVANGSGAAVRADINSQLQALGTLMSGPSAPATTYPYMWWADTTNGILKQRNGANTAWTNVLDLATGKPYGYAHSPSANGVLAPHRNLKITRPSQNTVSITADELLLTDPSTGMQILVNGVNQTPDITLAADRDGTLAGGWWYLWVATDGTNVHAFYSQSSDPSVASDPSGYIYKALVGAIWEDTTNGINNFLQVGGTLHWIPSGTIVNTGSGGVGNTSWNLLSLANYIPPIAAIAILQCFIYERTASTNTWLYISYDGVNAKYTVGGGTHAASYGNSESIEMLNNNQQIYYSVADANDSVVIQSHGFKF